MPSDFVHGRKRAPKRLADLIRELRGDLPEQRMQLFTSPTSNAARAKFQKTAVAHKKNRETPDQRKQRLTKEALDGLRKGRH